MTKPAAEASRRYGVTTTSVSDYCREYLKSINGWVKTEMFIGFDVRHCQDVPSFAKEYVGLFN